MPSLDLVVGENMVRGQDVTERVQTAAQVQVTLMFLWQRATRLAGDVCLVGQPHEEEDFL